jgi:phage shock protein E
MSHQLHQIPLTVGFALVVAFAGCGDGATKTTDSAVNDFRDVAGEDDGPDVRAAEVTPIPDATLTADLAGVDVTVPDGLRAEAPAAETTTVDAGCGGWSTLKRLSPAEAADLIANANPIVINVHYPYEGDIAGTDATIPFDDVPAIEAYLQYDRCADVLLVCRSGAMSENAGNALLRRGYLRIRDLKGGMVAWQAAGYPLLKDGGN